MRISPLFVFNGDCWTDLGRLVDPCGAGEDDVQHRAVQVRYRYFVLHIDWFIEFERGHVLD